MDLHQEANKVQASIQISRQSQQRNQEGITSQSLIQSRIADTSVQNVGQRPKHTKPEIAIMAVSRMRLCLPWSLITAAKSENIVN